MRNSVIIQKFIAYIDKILNYCDGIDYETFTANSMLVEACVFNLSQMGELANLVDKEFAELHEEIPWRLLYGLRNRIVHDYEGVNLQLIWEIITDDLVPLKDMLAKIQ